MVGEEKFVSQTTTSLYTCVFGVSFQKITRGDTRGGLLKVVSSYLIWVEYELKL